jgi:GNAT superfamily N-acetyltransferase
MQTTTRPLQASDYAAWLPLWQGYLTFYETVLSDAQTTLTWQRLLDPSYNLHGLVAVRDGNVVGITHYLFHPATWTPGDYCYLEDLFVNPTVRGTGAGRALIATVKAAAQTADASKLYWLTSNSNATARKLYDSVATDTKTMHYAIKL